MAKRNIKEQFQLCPRCGKKKVRTNHKYKDPYKRCSYCGLEGWKSEWNEIKKFQKAVTELPIEGELSPAYDPLTHKTITDLVFITQTELDILQEQPEEYESYYPKTQINKFKRKCEKFIKKYINYIE